MNWGAAATAVVGVTGIAGTFFAPYWGQSKLEGRRARSSFRKARRLVLDEVASLIAQLDLMLKAQRAPDDSTTALETPRWTQHAETLADYLEEGTWETVCDFFETTAILRRIVLGFSAGTPYNPDALALISNSRGQAGEAATALHEASKPDIA